MSVLRSILFWICAAVLFIFFRAGLCKWAVPVLGCDSPACPSAIGLPSETPCTPSGNHKEGIVWCEKVWAPHFNDLLKEIGQPAIVKCSAEDNFQLSKIIGDVSRRKPFVCLFVFFGATT